VNKAITIRSVNGAQHTMIDGRNANRCATLGSTEGHTNTVLSGFTLRNGRAENGAGAMYGTLHNCILSRNRSVEFGGGAYYSRLYNCLLSGNSAGYDGGGVYECDLTGCTLFGNTADWGGGAMSSTLNNSIVWGNSANTGSNHYYSVFDYSCTAPLPAGNGNMAADPLFVSADSGTLYLQADSPCINAGNNAFAAGDVDLAGNPRIQDGTVDMGAYEFVAYTETSPVPVPHYWLDQYGLALNGNHEAAAEMDCGKGYPVWRDYISGVNPRDQEACFNAYFKRIDADDIEIYWEPDLGSARRYIIEGCETLTGAWHPTSATNSPYRFFRVHVELPE